MLAARRYLALDYYVFSLRDSRSKAKWYTAVAAEEELKDTYGIVSADSGTHDPIDWSTHTPKRPER